MKSVLVFVAFFGILLEATQSASITTLDSADVQSISECQSCEYIMRFIGFQALNQAQSVNDIKEKLKALFKIVPSSLQNEEYITNVEKYLAMIRNGRYPQSICKIVSKCSSEQLALPRITACEVCTAVVDLIKAELKISNVTVQVIIQAVEALCAILGVEPVYEECKLILDELNQIIQWIEEQITPTDICERLGFCNKTLASYYATTQLSQNSSMVCDICMMVISTVDELLKNVDNKLDDVEDELNAICYALGDLADQCKSVVDMVLDELKKKVGYIEGKLDSTKTCQALYLCPSALNA